MAAAFSSLLRPARAFEFLLAVAVQVDPFESQALKPGDHISGSRVENQAAFKLWVNWIQLVQPRLAMRSAAAK
jgi:hypothetical protein